MSTVKDLITSNDNTLSFGDYTLAEKTKKDGFQFDGASYKVKTFKEITKLEKDGAFCYESVPGTAVLNMASSDAEISFEVEAPSDAEITVGVCEETNYEISIDGNLVGEMKSNLGGKLTFSVELSGSPVKVVIKRK